MVGVSPTPPRTPGSSPELSEKTFSLGAALTASGILRSSRPVL